MSNNNNPKTNNNNKEKEVDSDVESSASDTDSFVHVGSASGASSDSDWEHVSFHNSDDSDNSGEEDAIDEAIFDMDEIDLTAKYNFTTSPPHTVSSPTTQIPSTTSQTSSTTTQTSNTPSFTTDTDNWDMHDATDEDAMLAQAIFLSLQESERAKATPSTTAASIPTYPSYKPHSSNTSANTSYPLDKDDIKPDDPVEAIGVPLYDVVTLQNHYVKTVRQLAELNLITLAGITQRCPNIAISRAIAVEVMQKHAEKTNGVWLPLKITPNVNTNKAAAIPTTPVPNNNSNNNNNNNNAKLDFFMHERMEMSPEASLEVIGTTIPDIVNLNTFGVFTVRHLAALSLLKREQIRPKCSNIDELVKLAKEVVDSYVTQSLPKQPSAQPQQQSNPVQPQKAVAVPSSPTGKQEIVWGYHYLAESVYEQIKADKLVKSSYVLFQEYMECPLHLRSHHPWRRVYHAYLSDAAKWNGARGKHRVENLTDTDVYAFLVWRSADSFAKLDVTAGPRAIYFAWTQMPTDTWRTAIEIDKVLGEDLRNPTICDRYARVIRINLTELCQKQRGILHRVQLKGGALDTNHWLSTSLDEARDIQVSTDLWAAFEAGNSYFGCVPHGCIVMPNGTIPWECVDILETLNASTSD